ncbi:GNAT family N-acetyltransferase [Nocardia sp. 348MFTsu5.1]|uniref:GNAT family N-acetyltransferase n=1 Tax=Nocardia sp. 348MFTsu5.1 TaxID=1172185 RepID=UPI00037E5B31|nr:GNAT family N-acetyltransferase [Nocardia sp. 348MFTsu5.1]
MSLHLIEKRRTDRDDFYNWQPFGNDEGFTRAWWSDRTWHQDPDPWCLEVQQDGVEVARVELDNTDDVPYDVASWLGAEALEIVFIEVAEPFRRKGIASEAVQAIAALYLDRTLVAFSEGGDDFWSSLGWDRFDHADGPLLAKPLFIAPNGWLTDRGTISAEAPPRNIGGTPNP